MAEMDERGTEARSHLTPTPAQQRAEQLVDDFQQWIKTQPNYMQFFSLSQNEKLA